MLNNMKDTFGMNGGLVKCYLVDDLMRITSSYFNVYVPVLMNGIEQGLEDETAEPILDNILNDDKSNFKGVTLSKSIRARSIHPYTMRHDGWIPEFKTASATVESIQADSIDGVTELAPHPGGPGSHALAKALGLFKNIFNLIVNTNSTEVDYHDLNKKYIKKGHLLYGSFVIGGESDELVIVAIDDVVNYFDETSDTTGSDITWNKNYKY